MSDENLKRDVFCDGTKDGQIRPSLGHPGVYLSIPAEINQVACPYCGKIFKLQTEISKHRK